MTTQTNRILEGQLIGQNLRFAIVASRFNDFITDKLVAGCQDMLIRHGVDADDITLVWVPGAFEIPFAAARLVQQNRFNAIITLGCVIKGSTPHFDYVSGEVAKGVGQLNSQGKTPVVFGVLTTNTIEQAIERAGTKAGNKGVDAAMTALEMANLTFTIDSAVYPTSAATGNAGPGVPVNFVNR